MAVAVAPGAEAGLSPSRPAGGIPSHPAAAERRLAACAGREGSGAARREGAGACAVPPEAAPPLSAPLSEEGRPAPGPAFNVLLGGPCPERGGRRLGRPRGCGPRPLRLSPPGYRPRPVPGGGGAAGGGAGERGWRLSHQVAAQPSSWTTSAPAAAGTLPSVPLLSSAGTGSGSRRANSSCFRMPAPLWVSLLLLNF